MTPEFLIDNNLSLQLVKGMREFGESVRHVREVYNGVGNTPDPIVLADAGRGGLTIISRDLRNRRVPDELESIRRYKVGGFWLSGKDLTRCEIIQQVVRNWPRMKKLAAKTPRPFIFYVRPHGKIEQYSL